jgi:rare lipoprotein A
MAFDRNAAVVGSDRQSVGGLMAWSGGLEAGFSAVARIGTVAGCCLALAHCSQVSSKLDPKYGVSASPRIVEYGQPVPKGGGTYRVGKPYVVGGRTYSPEENSRYTAEGTASWYGRDFHGRLTANGEIYDMDAISAAHPTLPIPSYARVTNLNNKRSIIVRINDRGPYHANRLIDVSARTAKLLGFYDNGTTQVRVDYVGRAALGGSDDIKLEATLRRGTPAPGVPEIKLASTSGRFAPRSLDQAAQANVPVPPDRPYELGQDNASSRVAGRRAPANAVVASAARAPAASSHNFASRFAPAERMPTVPSQVEPVSAFADSGSSNGAMMSGRGLY